MTVYLVLIIWRLRWRSILFLLSWVGTWHFFLETHGGNFVSGSKMMMRDGQLAGYGALCFFLKGAIVFSFSKTHPKKPPKKI